MTFGLVLHPLGYFLRLDQVVLLLFALRYLLVFESAVHGESHLYGSEHLPSTCFSGVSLDFRRKFQLLHLDLPSTIVPAICPYFSQSL